MWSHGCAPCQEVQAECRGSSTDENHEDARDQALAREGVRPARVQRSARRSGGVAAGKGYGHGEGAGADDGVCLSRVESAPRGDREGQLTNGDEHGRRGDERTHWRGLRCTRSWWPCHLEAGACPAVRLRSARESRPSCGRRRSRLQAGVRSAVSASRLERTGEGQ